MSNFNTRYKKYVESKSKISPYDIERGRFYLIKEYINVEGQKIKYNEAQAPIIFVLFTSKRKDEIHAIKISNTNPNLIRKLFKNLVDKETNDIELHGSSKLIYNSILKKVPTITNETYRTYKWDGIKLIFELNIDDKAVLPEKKEIKVKKPKSK